MRHDHGAPGVRIRQDRALDVEDPAHDVPVDDALHRSGRDDPTVSHGDDVVGVAGGQAQVVEHHDHRHTLAVQASNGVEHFELVRDVEVGGGLVEQEDGGALGQCERDPRALPLPAGEGLKGVIRQVAQAGALERIEHEVFVDA